MKKMKRIIVMLLAALMLSSVIAVTPSQDVEAKTTVNSVVKNARYYYNNTNSLIKKGKLKAYRYKKSLGYEDWWSGNKLRKGIVYPAYDKSGVYAKGYTAVEYYYDKNEKIVFIFAYKKVNGKTKEYRCYYGTNRKLYRYINDKKKTYNYSSGKSQGSMPSVPKYLYGKAVHYLHLAHY